eukprot:TRINITY_DN16977_c0_g5_i1.p1 TRINITY_DN16977_c0_g5~~TRINITY_DN16977_c0_g5_i1.p1  ORF type:complete len:923 (+),score=166.61 TRINITY_DN16977_c0_g5_i1:53-2821(+)
MTRIAPVQHTQHDGCHDSDDSPSFRAQQRRDSWGKQRGSVTMQSISSIVDEVDDSSDEDDHETHREATEVCKISELLQEHCGTPNWEDSAVSKTISDIPYKGRKYKGKLLHVAALSRENEHHLLVERLLDLKAKPDEPAHGDWPGVAVSGVEVQPIHLAAAVGNLDVVRSLLRHGADVDAQSKHDARDHYTALHDAVWFSHDEVVIYLMRKDANLDIQNTKGETPLHLAVRSHDLPIVKHLMKQGANPKIPANGGETAIHLAMQFCPETFGIVADKSMKSLLMAAKVGGADEHLAFRTIVGKDGQLKPAWQKALKKESDSAPDLFLEQILTLCKRSPLAAVALLEGLATEPAAVHTQYTVPKTASVHEKFFPTALLENTQWPDPTSSEGQKQMSWMTHLCNGKPDDVLHPHAVGASASEDDEDEQLVSMRVLSVRGLVNPDFLEVIADADENGECLCQSIVSLAVMSYCWTGFAKATAIANTIYRSLAVALLTCSVFLKIVPTESNLFLNQVCWNGVAAIVTFELLCSLILLAKVMIRALTGSFLEAMRNNVTNFLEWVFNGVSFYMICVSAQEGFDLCAVPSLAALTLLVRWLLLAWSLRTVDGVGQILLPIILASFEPVKGVLLVALFGFIAFFTAFLALGSAAAQNVNVLSVLINTMRLLLLSDGDGIDAVLRAFGDDEAEFQLVGVAFLAAAIFMFVIVILNLLIAAYGEASLKDGEVKFRQQLAQVCLNAWRRPSWPFGFSACRLPDGNVFFVYIAVMFIGVGGWILLFAFARDYAAICGWPALALLMGDCILNQKPWQDENEEGTRLLHLWMCHQKKLEHAQRQTLARLDEPRDHYKKLSRRLDVRHRKLHRKMDEMMGTQRATKTNQLPPVAQAPQQENEHCHSCHSVYMADALFCSRCGQKRCMVGEREDQLLE